MVLQSCKPVVCKGGNEGIHVGTGHLQTARDALFVPAFGPQPDDGPAGVIGVGKLRKGQQRHLELDRARMAGQKGFDGVVIGFVAEFPWHEAHEFAVMDGGRELLHIEHVCGDWLGIAMAFAAGVPRPLIDQPQHPFGDKTTGFVPDGGPFQARLATAFGNGVGKEDKRANDFVVVLNVIDEVQLRLRELLCSRHARPPVPGGEASRVLPWRDAPQPRGRGRYAL